LKGFDTLVNLVLDECIEYMRGKYVFINMYICIYIYTYEYKRISRSISAFAHK